MKKMILLAFAAASLAMLPSPAVSSAGTWHAKGAAAFAATGGTTELTTTAGTAVHCTGVTVQGVYETTTKGKVSFTFTGCKSLGITCLTSGYSSGAFATTALPFHNVHLEPDGTKPGILITPSSVDNVPSAGEGHFATFSCVGVPVVWRGSGLLAEISAPKCGETSASQNWLFARASQGHQKWTQVTTSGTTYGLTQKTGGNEYSSLSVDASLAASFGNPVTVNCT